MYSEKLTTLTRRILATLAVATLLAGVPGCSSLSDALSKFDAAIAEVKNTRITIERESKQWRDESKLWRKEMLRLQGQLKADVKEVISDDLTDLVVTAIREIGKEFRCNSDFVEQKLIRYLKSIEAALQAKRDEIARTKKLDGPARNLIKRIIDEYRNIDPYVCHSKPEHVKVKYTNSFGESPKLQAEEASVGFNGFALLRQPEKESQKYSVEIRGVEKEKEYVRSVKIASGHLPMAHYELTLNLSKVQFQEGDLKLSLRWGNELLHEVDIKFGKKPEQPKETVTPPRKGNWIVNGSGDDGLKGWGPANSKWKTVPDKASRARSGSRMFWPGDLGLKEGESTELYQVVDIREIQKQVEQGLVRCNFEGWVMTCYARNADICQIIVQFEDEKGEVIGDALDSKNRRPIQPNWEEVAFKNVKVPEKCRNVRVRLRAIHDTGDDTDSYFDDISLSFNLAQ